MDVRTCRQCKRIFNYLSGPSICPACKQALEEKFQEVKKYIQDHPGVNIPVVAEECDVDAKQIKQWLREERLELSDSSASFLTCDSCGATIRSGKFCEKCKSSMANSLQSVITPNKPAAPTQQKKDKENPKMRFLQ